MRSPCPELTQLLPSRDGAHDDLDTPGQGNGGGIDPQVVVEAVHVAMPGGIGMMLGPPGSGLVERATDAGVLPTPPGMADNGDLATVTAINQCARQLGAALGLVSAVAAIGTQPHFHNAWLVSAGFAGLWMISAATLSSDARRTFPKALRARPGN
jgi:hypothetical protein